MQYVVTGALVIVAVIHLLPLTGVMGLHKLETLYGVRIEDRNLAMLMRHRSVLFGLLGVFFLVAAFRPHLQVPAFVAGFVSVLSFLWLARPAGGYNAQVRRVFVADIVALVSLLVGAVAYAVQRAG